VRPPYPGLHSSGSFPAYPHVYLEGMIWRYSAWLLAFLPLAGCAITVQEFRQTPLQYVTNVQGLHRPMPACIQYELESNIHTWPDMFQSTSNLHDSSLLISRSQPSGPFGYAISPLTEFIFMQAGPTDVSIHVRYRASLRADHFVQKAKPFFESCGHASLQEDGQVK